MSKKNIIKAVYLVFSIASPALFSANIYIDDDWAGKSVGEKVLWFKDESEHTIGTDAFANVKTALASSNVQNGDTIQIAPGLYLESDIYIDKSVSIVGAGDLPSEVLFAPDQDSNPYTQPWNVAPWNNWPSTSHQCFIIYADNISIENLSVDGSGVSGRIMDYHLGITSDFRTLSSYGVEGKNCNYITIKNVIVKNCFRRGIQIRSKNSTRLLGWKVENAIVSGMKGYFDWPIEGSYENEQNIGIVAFGAECEITNCSVSACGTGIASGSTGTYSIAVMNGNSVTRSKIAYQFVGVTTGSEFKNNTAVVDNSSEDAISSDGIGMVIWDFNSSTSCYNNSFSGSGLKYGIQFLWQNRDISYATIENNTIVGSGIPDSAGIWATNYAGEYGGISKFTVNGANISGFNYGILLENGLTSNKTEMLLKEVNIFDNYKGIKAGANTKIILGSSTFGSISVKNGIVFESDSFIDWNPSLSNYNALLVDGNFEINYPVTLTFIGDPPSENTQYLLAKYDSWTGGSFILSGLPSGWSLINDSEDTETIYLKRDSDSIWIGSVSPFTGTTAGGDSVTITGSGFTGATDVKFDGISASSIVVVNDTTITCNTPAHAAQTVDVTVQVGSDSATLTRGFTYKDETFNVLFLSAGNGSISGSTTQTVVINGNCTEVTAVPDTNYHFVEWTKDGYTFSTNPSITVTNVTEKMTFIANFARNTATLTMAISGGLGTTNPEIGNTLQNTNESISALVTPATGYHFINWTKSGFATLGNSLSQNTIISLSGDATITANIAKNIYKLEYIAGTNGNLSGETTQFVEYADNGTPVEAVPNNGYHFYMWSDGSKVNPRTDLNVSSNLSVTAIFTINPPRDLNFDGIADMIVENSSDGVGVLYLMDGTTPIASNQIYQRTPELEIVAIEDFNGDKKADLLWRDSSNGKLIIYLMDGFTIVNTGIIYAGDTGWQFQLAADFDNDKKADILLEKDNSGLLYLMNGLEISDSGIIYNKSADTTLLTSKDFDGDGCSDLLFETSAKMGYVMLMNGLTVKDQGTVWNSRSSSWQIIKYADFNGDAKCDILWENTVSGKGIIYLMNGKSLVAGTAYASKANSWQVKSTGDFNGDGKADILWENNISGKGCIYLMNGSLIQSVKIIYIKSNPAWNIINTLDYNGDGKADILWRNSDTSKTLLYLMNGTNIEATGKIFVPPSGENWNIINP